MVITWSFRPPALPATTPVSDPPDARAMAMRPGSPQIRTSRILAGRRRDRPGTHRHRGARRRCRPPTVTAPWGGRCARLALASWRRGLSGASTASRARGARRGVGQGGGGGLRFGGPAAQGLGFDRFGEPPQGDAYLCALFVAECPEDLLLDRQALGHDVVDGGRARVGDGDQDGAPVRGVDRPDHEVAPFQLRERLAQCGRRAAHRGGEAACDRRLGRVAEVVQHVELGRADRRRFEHRFKEELQHRVCVLEAAEDLHRRQVEVRTALYPQLPYRRRLIHSCTCSNLLTGNLSVTV